MLSTAIANVLMVVINDEEINTLEGILHHEEGGDILPANIELSGLEVSILNALSREFQREPF